MTNAIASRRLLDLAVLALLVSGCGRQVQVSSPPATPPAATSAAIDIRDGESLVRAMHARYADKWYRTLTFVQKTTLIGSSGVPTVQTWYEAMSLPGRLRIDYGNPEAGNGLLFRADSNYQFSGGRLGRTAAGWNELLVLGFDVYAQPPDVTISVLRNIGFNMSRLRTDNLDGKAVYVVGATSRNDSTSKQFWVEREHLLFVRLQERQASGRQSDIRFGDYVPAGNGWVARQVFQVIDGRLRLREDYTNVKADVPLDPALFDPKQWSTVKHWTKP
jgi:hypothetical protein